MAGVTGIGDDGVRVGSDGHIGEKVFGGSFQERGKDIGLRGFFDSVVEISDYDDAGVGEVEADMMFETFASAETSDFFIVWVIMLDDVVSQGFEVDVDHHEVYVFPGEFQYQGSAWEGEMVFVIEEQIALSDVDGG